MKIKIAIGIQEIAYTALLFMYCTSCKIYTILILPTKGSISAIIDISFDTELRYEY